MKKIIVVFVFLLVVLISKSQNRILSNNANISIITIGSGHLLNESFGHSAIRVLDKSKNFDKIYNYGVFDFRTKGFYIKFMRGKLLYDLGTDNTYRFFKSYTIQNRSIKEQVLNLTTVEKQKYFDFLENNAKPENKKYLYDFFHDNCATKLREVTTTVLSDKVNYNDETLKNNFTFRDLITQKLTNQVWGKFGIDIALGSVIDRKATAKQYTFLPSYTFDNFKNAVVKVDGEEIPFVKKTNIIYTKNEQIKIKTKKENLTPMALFLLIALFILFFTLKDFKNKKHSKWLDFIILFSTGLVGLLVFLLWFATDHSATKNNFNIFWAFLPNLIIAFSIFKNKYYIKKYYLLLLILLILMIVFWVFKIQVFNKAMLPIVLMLGFRYYFNWKYFYNKS